MKRIFLLLSFIILIGVILAVLSLYDPGLVQLTWMGYEIQMTATLFFLILFLSFFSIIIIAWMGIRLLEILVRWVCKPFKRQT
ncbi:MAG: hypothetical protein K2W92_00965 [Alphaproteobacteria bacterium]|nr:hypothetical protein [Alphaproteobacteria bacterium]